MGVLGAAREAGMTILLIEYRTPDFGGWKEMVDRDPMDREGHGVTRHWLYQDADDPTHIMLSLEFPSTDKARVFLSALAPVRDVSGVVRHGSLARLRRSVTEPLHQSVDLDSPAGRIRTIICFPIATGHRARAEL
jgi:hypothetical protein